MPRAFTGPEREAIRNDLVESARSHFARFGYRRTNVADIAGDAGIGKGSFYLFFESKAAAFMEVAGVVEAEIRMAYLDEAARRPGADVRDRVRHLLSFQVEALRDEPFLRIALDPQEASILFRELPPSVAGAHQRADVAFFERLLEGWAAEGVELDAAPAVLVSVLRALYVVVLHRDLIGPESSDEALALLIDGAARALTRPTTGGP